MCVKGFRALLAHVAGGYIFSEIFWFVGVKNKPFAGIFLAIFSVFISSALFVRTGSFGLLMNFIGSVRAYFLKENASFPSKMSDWAYFQKVRRFQKHILLTYLKI
jgi:hypothetical protein